MFFVMAAVLFCGCDKEEGGDNLPCPVTEVSVPASSEENPVSPGSSVTIQGQGFTANSEIWLRAITRAADVQAEVTDVTATTVTFTAPEVSGEQNILLKQDGGEWILGVLHFPEVTEILPKKIVKIICMVDGDNESTQTMEYTYDETDRLKQIDKTEEYDGYNFSSTTSIEYTENSVTARYNDQYGKDDQQIFYLENGRATNSSYSESDYKCETKYSYGDNGYLTAAGMTEIQNGESETYRAALTIKDGCIEKYSDEDGYSISFTPNTAVPNNLNLDLLGFDELLDDIDESVAEAYWLGVGGTRSKYLPEQLIVNDYGYQFTIKYEYQFDGEYLSEIRIISDEFDSTTLKLYYEE